MRVLTNGSSRSYRRRTPSYTRSKKGAVEQAWQGSHLHLCHLLIRHTQQTPDPSLS